MDLSIWQLRTINKHARENRVGKCSLDVVVAHDLEAPCYRHANKRWAVHCQRCARPICKDCMTRAEVGFHCPECSKAASSNVVRMQRRRASSPIALMVIIGINIVAFLAQMAPGTTSVTNDYLLFGPAVEADQYWRLITGGFLHANWLHIGFNMYFVWIFGQYIVQAYGTLKMLVIYFGALLGASLAVVAFNFNQPTLGASGAAMGLAAALLVVFRERRIPLRETSLGFILFLNLALPLFNTQISFWGHFGGAVFGFAVAFLVSRTRRLGFATSVAIGIVICLALFVAGVVVSEAGGVADVAPLDLLTG